MYELAKNQESTEPTTIKSISTRWELSDAYLEQLFASLKKAGLLTSKRGAQGGYFLARDAKDISIGEIILALEGSISITNCIDSKECGEGCQCPSRNIFINLQRSIDEAMQSMSLADMLEDDQILIEEVE